MSENPDDQQPKPHNQKPLRDRVINVRDLDNLPDPQPLIASTIDLGTVVLLAGPSQSLKSFIALDWAASIASGHPWHSRPTAQQRVLYIAGEGAHGISKRLRAWQITKGVTIPPEQFSLLTTPVPLLDPIALFELCQLVREDGYGFVVIDTLSKSIAGADENSAKDISAAVKAFYQIQEATNGGTVVPLHHTGKDQKTIRGSSALESGVDTVYSTSGTAQGVTLNREKRKDGPVEDSHEVRFTVTPGTESGTITRQTIVGISQVADTLISHITSHYGQTGVTRAQLVETSGISKTTLYRTITDLHERGELVNIGTDKRPIFRRPQR